MVKAKRPGELVSILQADFVSGQVPITQTTLSASQATIEFSDISSDYRTLILMAELRTDYALGIDYARLRFNGDTGANYDQLRVAMNTSGLDILPNRAASRIICLATEAAGSTASTFGTGMIWIPGYKSDRHKRVIALSGAFGPVSVDTDLYAVLSVGSWRDSSAVTTITLLPSRSDNFVSGSSVALYGVV